MAKKNKIITRIISAVVATVIALAPLAYSIQVNAWGTPIGSGVIHMTDSSRSVELFNSSNEYDTLSCNAKAVERDGNWVPVYCIEKGRTLNSGDTVNAEMYENGDWSHRYGMSIRDAVGMIYICGYNGENGWGVPDINIYNRDASAEELLGNGNYQKYVATQALIWEAVSGNTYYSRNDAIQGEINVLRGRISNYINRSVRGEDSSGGITLYRSIDDAQANYNGPTSVDGDRTGHFAYSYGSYTPANSSNHWGPVIDYNDSDITSNTIYEPITFEWNRIYNGGVEAGQGGEVIYDLDENDAANLWGVILWRPENGNQLCISATGTAEKVYASFYLIYSQEKYIANATVNTVKVDDRGNPARGAEFTVYNEDGSVVGTMSDVNNDGHYSLPIRASVFGDEGGIYYYDSDVYGNPITTPIVRNYTIRETSPATEVYVDGAWISASFVENNDVYSISVSVARDTGVMTWSATGSNGGTAVRDVENLTHADISFGTSGGNTVNVPYVTADYSFQIAKVDDQNRTARGAEFTVYSDSACTNALGTMTDSGNNGNYSFSGSFSNQLRTATASQTVTLYVKETVAADQILNGNDWEDVTCALDGTVHTVVFTWNPATGEMTGTIDADHSVSSTRAANTLSSDISADWTAYPIVNVPYVSADYEFEIAKIDDMDRTARGAEFTVYSDSACTNAIGTMTDTSNDGIYSFSGSFADDLRSNADDQTLTLYVRETVAADQILYDGSWIDVECELDDTVYTVVITWNPSTGAMSATWEGDREATSSRDNSSLSSSITADWTDEPIVNVVLTSGSLTIEKQDDQTGEALTGAIFGVYVDADLSGTYDPTIDTPYAQLTDPDGDGKYTMTDMPIQGYIVRELIAPDGYEIDPNTYAFEIVPGNLDVVIDNVQYTVLDTTAGIFVDGNAITGTEFLSMEDSSHMLVYAEDAVFVDHVAYNGLLIGQTYESVAIVYDKATGEPLTDTYGNIITNTVVFTATETTGVIEVPLTINTLVWESGRTIVCFEDLYRETDNGRVHVGVHHDLSDENQTITPPSGQTTFMGSSTGTHVAPADTSVSLTDVVSYEGLEVGRTYSVTGIIMVKNEDGESTELTNSNGDIVTATTTFTATANSGTVDVVFDDIDTTLLLGKDLVAFETITTSEFTIWVHADINDDNQTVEIPNMGTTATVGGDKVFNPSDSIELNDVVAYENLVPGQTYEVVGVLMNRSTGEMFNGITSSTRFVPDIPNGEVTVTFTFNGSSLQQNDQLVVFERLYLVTASNDEEITTLIITHENLTDDDQTVTVEIPPIIPPFIPSTGEVGSEKVIIGVCAVLMGGVIALIILKRKEERM